MKFKKLSLILSISCIFLFNGCSLFDSNKSSNSSSTKEENEVSENTTSQSQKETTLKTTNDEKNNSKKNEYLEKLNKIEAGLSDLDSYKSGTTLEMKYAASEEYKRWDTALNEIYEDLQNTLSSSDMSKLKEDEIKWISEKENIAKEESEIYKGGTAEGLSYTASLAKSTKDRCYKLVNDYM